MLNFPILYSFRRCPYAMRARMAIVYAEQAVSIREVILRDKPQAMLTISPKGTVPVLQLPNGQVIEESFDIMLWAVAQQDPQGWLPAEATAQQQMHALIQTNDTAFKKALDRYKYPDRFPDVDVAVHYKQCLQFIEHLEQQLSQHQFLLEARASLADVAIFPFVRQFARVDEAKFNGLPYTHLIQWFHYFNESPWFVMAMKKYPQWQPEQTVTVFP